MGDDLPLMTILLRLGIALVFGAVIGWEREHKERPAGLRTHMLVALGSAAFTLVALAMIHQYMQAPDKPLPIDPAKIIAGIVGGVGFLGAGAIIHGHYQVRGLTTAAGILVVASVGVASAAGYYKIAGVCVAMAVFTLIVLRWFEAVHSKSPRPSEEENNNEE